MWIYRPHLSPAILTVALRINLAQTCTSKSCCCCIDQSLYNFVSPSLSSTCLSKGIASPRQLSTLYSSQTTLARSTATCSDAHALRYYCIASRAAWQNHVHVTLDHAIVPSVYFRSVGHALVLLYRSLLYLDCAMFIWIAGNLDKWFCSHGHMGPSHSVPGARRPQRLCKCDSRF